MTKRGMTAAGMAGAMAAGVWMAGAGCRANHGSPTGDAGEVASETAAAPSASVLTTSIKPPVRRIDDLEPAASSSASIAEMKARRLLEPRVWSGRATIDEARMLKAICRHQRDTECVQRVDDKLKELWEAAREDGGR